MTALKDIFTELKPDLYGLELAVLHMKQAGDGLCIVLDTDAQSLENLAALEGELKRVYNLASLEFKAGSHKDVNNVSDRIKAELAARFPSVSCAILSVRLDGEVLHTELSSEYDRDRLCDIEQRAVRHIEQTFGLRVRFEMAVSGSETQSFEQEREKLIEEMSRNMPVISTPQKEENTRTFTRSRHAGGPKLRAAEANMENLIYGKPITAAKVKIADIMWDSGNVTVEGEVVSAEKRKLNGRDTTVLSFIIYDGTGSFSAVCYLNDKEVKQVAEQITRGSWLIAQGQVRFSEYDNGDNLRPKAIFRGEKPQRRDNAPQKRVELHLHTTMSSMDAMCDTAGIISLAAGMGHRAIAITDHGVAQAFPDAMKAAASAEKAGMPIKVLYGVEAYCENDVAKKRAVKGVTGALLSDEIVAFDIETTGLSPRNCEIIEIAALIVKNGEVVGDFHSYVRPTDFIPYNITELTGITDEMVRDAPPISEVLPAFKAFVKGRPLVAHNADFDIGFIKKACDELEIEWDICSIDTVSMARVLMPGLKNHRLNTVAEAFGLTFNHHRAQDDTRVLAEIFMSMLELLSKRFEVERVSELNDALSAISDGTQMKKDRNTNHMIIIARNRKGLTALYKMISDSHLHNFSARPIIPLSQVLEHRENLILGSACEAGELFQAVLFGENANSLKRIAKNYDFLEIQPTGNNAFMIDKKIVKNEEELRELNRTIVKLGEQTGIPVCATGDVHFIEPNDSVFREIIQTVKEYDGADKQAPLYYRTTEEMLEEFEYLGEKKAYEVVVKNTNLIADMCETVQPIMKGTFPPKIEGSAEELQRIVKKRAHELYGVDGALPEIVAQRLDDELTPIIGQGFDVMYIIAQKLVKKSMDSGYLVGSRGSVGSSFVAFLAGITEVNALKPHYLCKKCRYSEYDSSGKYRTGVDMPDADCPVCGERLYKDGYNIPFATFLGFEADKQPDIDLNFSGEYQAQAHRDTIELFGEDHVFRAGTISSIKDRTAYGYVKKYLEKKGLVVSPAEETRLVNGCTGVKRTTGQHPGGLIVVPEGIQIYEFCPVQRPADDPKSNTITTHFDYHSIEDNLLKLDLLGHDDPTVIRRLHDLSGIDPTTIPLDDKATMRIFTDIGGLNIETDDILEQTGAAGIPEFGTKFVRGMLTETRPTTFDGLLRISGLSHGTNVWRNNAQDIIKAGLASLDGVICVRDDMTVLLIEKGLPPKLAFTISESVRKGRGLKPDWEAAMLEQGLPKWYLDSCNKIEYLFPRAHATAYVMMGYRIAWFKVHRPMEFYSAYFSIRAPGFDAAKMIYGDGPVCQEYRALKAKEKRSDIDDDTMITLEICHEFYKRGFSFAPLDIYTSEVSGFGIDGNRLVPPFTSIAGLGDQAAQSIVEARKNGPFSSIEDLKLRCDKLSDTLVEKLAEAGALGGLPKSEQISLFDN